MILALETFSAWKATQLRELPFYQVSFLEFFIYLEILILCIYFLINCLVHIFNLLFSLISHLNILLLFYFSCEYIVAFYYYYYCFN